MANRYTILSTKTLPAILHEIAEENNILLRTHAFLQITPVYFSTEGKEEINQLIQTSDVTVFTSQHAVKAIAEFAIPPARICCIGGNTLDTVQKIFPQAAIVATGDNGASLASEIIADENIHSAAFFCSKIRRDVLPERLLQNNIALREVIVYETLSDSIPIEGPVDGILFFSPSAVAFYFQNNTLAPDTVCFAIGHTTGDSLKEYTSNTVVVNEDKPSAQALLQLAITYFNNHN
ncbi:uroporphyrinogen-III synthase [Chitinophaga sp.]|uniref:uroporphyrinogen-III synthase n=1 Tax=Chitinophaga sp. TaxID=1869181 RepID=UPI0031CE2608